MTKDEKKIYENRKFKKQIILNDNYINLINNWNISKYIIIKSV